MATTIQISAELRQTLNERKFVDKETYEEVIWDILEDAQELSQETKKEIEQARNEIKAGKVYSLTQIKKELEL